MPTESWKIYSWNVNGIRAAAKKGLSEWILKEEPDILCVQETKAQEAQLGSDITDLQGYVSHWVSAEKKGYSGVGTYLKPSPKVIPNSFGHDRFKDEGRAMIVEFEAFTLLNVYFPNGRRDKQRLKYKMEFYEAILDHWEQLRKEGKKLIICGDVNTAHKEIDLARPEQNAKVSGFLPEERTWIDKIIALGYVDIFRTFNQEPDNYSYWDMKTRARDRNVGWRIDYFFVTENLVPSVKNAWIDSDVMGSDHCPIGIAVEVNM